MEKGLLSSLLHLDSPFEIQKVEQEQGHKGSKAEEILVIYIGLGEDWQAPEGWRVNGYHKRRWRHLNLFEYTCYLEFNLPILRHIEGGQTRNLEVSWSRPYSRFTLQLEEHIVELVRLCHCIQTVANLLGENRQRIQQVYDYYTLPAYEKQCQQAIAPFRTLGLDETSSKKGHDYITLFVDMDKVRILDIQPGKDGSCVKRFVQRCSQPQAIEQVSMDMSPAFVSAVEQYLPQAAITFDKFHIVRHIHKALEELRPYDAEMVGWCRDALQPLYTFENKPEMSAFLQFWTDYVKELLGARKLAKSLTRHFDGIVQYAYSYINNGLLEGINSKIQYLKRIARGYRYQANFMRMILFAFGSLHVISS